MVARRPADDSLAIRAAWLHYGAGLTQAEVAARLGVSGVKAHRLVTRASQIGAVKVSIDGAVVECLEAGERLIDRFGLSFCDVVPNLYESGLPLRALGMAGAGYLRRQIEALQQDGGVIGFGHGRTLAAAVASMPHIDGGRVQFVSLLGGLTRNFSANPHDVMHRLAQSTGSAAYVLPVPFFANTVADRNVLLAQRGVQEVFQLAERADLMVVGVGTAQPDAQLVASRMIDIDEIREVQAGGGVGELLGHFFDRDGRPVETALSARTVSPGLDVLRQRRVVAIAGGEAKIDGIRSVLSSGILSGLITDEGTAAAILDERQV
ncbi:sugar-binding transcriptional regulator [Aureimonas frigidaquae]|uniref:Ery operon, transcriptional repressor n=1 Tax=Aureimonas frigidaquae TaxID=424757 RepID=A0A0P0Z304_9HYPH|nr:sugar-binding transcriptional regulator [Aureimonas frigidaquae]BAT28475.1 Ery operon, transcriptional repressor [Aureimonas frigidaquae]